MKFLFQVCLFVKILQCNEIFLPGLGKVCEQITDIMMSLTELFNPFQLWWWWDQATKINNCFIGEIYISSFKNYISFTCVWVFVYIWWIDMKLFRQLNNEDDERDGNRSKNGDDRERKMRSRDCEVMGITWLLNKNRNAYIHTVSSVLRALMMSTNGRDPQSCTLNSDGMPLAVDSSEINDQSSSSSSSLSRVFHTYFCIILLPLGFFV